MADDTEKNRVTRLSDLKGRDIRGLQAIDSVPFGDPGGTGYGMPAITDKVPGTKVDGVEVSANQKELGK